MGYLCLALSVTINPNILFIIFIVVVINYFIIGLSFYDYILFFIAFFDIVFFAYYWVFAIVLPYCPVLQIASLFINSNNMD